METFNLIIPALIKNEMWQYSSLTDREVCGVLLGKKQDPNVFIISHVIFDDKPLHQSCSGVARNTKNVYSYVRANVEKSEDLNIDYIGDWHSHPGMSCGYSSIDALAIEGLLDDPAYNFLEGIILIIVNPPQSIKGYYFPRRGYLVFDLNVI